MWQTRYLLTLVCVGALTTSASRADNTGPQQGELAPAFTIDAMLDASRKPPTLESLRGKPIVLEFWATWCPLCVADIPRLNGFVEDFKDKITFISVTDEKVDVVKPFLETHPLKPLIALDQDRSMLDGYKVTSVPTSVFIRADGTIDAVCYSRDVTKAALEHLAAGESSGIENLVRPGEVRHAANIEPALFEVTIRPSTATESRSVIGRGMKTPQGHTKGITATSSTVEEVIRLLQYAANGSPGDVIVETELPADRYDFGVKVVTEDDALPRKLLLDAIQQSFGIVITRENRLMDVYVATFDKTGITLQPVPDDVKYKTEANASHDSFTGVNTSAYEAALALSKAAGRLIVPDIHDDTQFNATVHWDEAGGVEAMKTAVKSQLGITLTPDRRELPMTVVRKAASTTQRAP